MAKGYTVTIENDYGFGCDYIPVAVGVDERTAKSIRRHYLKVFDKLGIGTKWDNTGLYCGVISRTYCTNHADFERLSVEYPMMLPDFIRQAYCKEVIA